MVGGQKIKNYFKRIIFLRDLYLGIWEYRSMNKKDALSALQAKLATDVRWAQRGLLAIFRNQTADEQVGADVRHDNAMGFRCMDSYILTSFALQLQQRGSLSPKQMAIVFKKMPIYARQLMKFYGDKIVQVL
jgi:hypothetical protein